LTGKRCLGFLEAFRTSSIALGEEMEVLMDDTEALEEA